jgi:preprotein translocase subunit SecG
METLLLIVHVLVGAGVVGLVLLQHGKGADMGAAFGSGSSGSLFGASGSANFLSRTTSILAAVFFLTSLGLTYVATHKTPTKGVMDAVKSVPGKAPSGGEKPPVPAAVPAAPGGDGSRASEVPK